MALLGAAALREFNELLDNPARFLRRPATDTRQRQELRTLALMRLAASDPAEAAAQLQADPLPGTLGGWAWATVGRQAAFKLDNDAAAHYANALAQQRGAPDWSDDTLAWGVRSTLRSAAPDRRWPQVLRLVEAMSPAEPSRTRPGPTGAPAPCRPPHVPGPPAKPSAPRRTGLLSELAGPLHFYSQLAAEALGQSPGLPPAPERPPPRPSAAPRASTRGCSGPCCSTAWACATRAGANGTTACAA